MSTSAPVSAYSKYDNSELRQFICQRGIQKRPRKRENIIRILETADEEATFRLLDLPSELRKIIYEYAINFKVERHTWRTMPLSRFTADPTILRTCKSVHDEAVGIIYQSNHFFDFTVYANGQMLPNNVIAHSNYTRIIDLYSDDFRKADNYYYHLLLKPPPFLSRTANMTIRVYLNDDPMRPHMLEESAGMLVDHTLHQLYQQLHEKSCLRRLRIELYSGTLSEDRLFRNMLSPLSAIAAAVPDAEFHVSPSVSEWMRDSTLRMATYLEVLLPLQDDIRLAILLAKKSESTAGDQKGAVDESERLLRPCRRDGVFKGASDSKLKKAFWK